MEAVTEFSSIKELLRYSDLFQGLTDAELHKLLTLCREEVYEAGSVIFPEGVPFHTVSIVESGKVALDVQLHISRAREDTATITTVTRPNSLCFSGLIDPNILTATGRALEKTKLINLYTAELIGLLEQNPKIGYTVMKNVAAIAASRLGSTRETLGHILSVVFHDLKAPLAAIESYHRVMLGGFAGELNEEQKNMLQRSSRRIIELLDLLSNIVDVSRVDAKNLVMSEISLGQVVVDSVETMQPLAEDKGLQLKVEMDAEIPTIHGTQQRLKQVVTNLLSNAIKFTPSGGMVSVKIKNNADYARVEIADTGPGIPAEELPKIFDDYYRGLDMAERGAGLGLSIAKRIIEAHQGKLWAISPCPGSDKGSQFIFTIPTKTMAKGGMIGENFDSR